MNQFNKVIIKLSAYMATISFLFIMASVKADEFDPAWSLDFTIKPEQTDYLGQSVETIHEELHFIQALSCEQGVLTQEQCQQVSDSGGQFSMLVDANQDGEFERWQVAFAELKTGEQAKVLLIQDLTTHKVLQTIILTSEGSAFSALYFQQGQLYWGMCISCDVLADVNWQGGAFQLEWQTHQISYATDELPKASNWNNIASN